MVTTLQIFFNKEARIVSGDHGLAAFQRKKMMWNFLL
jgi:hypothetical protein